jgi:hypothetical protein
MKSKCSRLLGGVLIDVYCRSGLFHRWLSEQTARGLLAHCLSRCSLLSPQPGLRAANLITSSPRNPPDVTIVSLYSYCVSFASLLLFCYFLLRLLLSSLWLNAYFSVSLILYETFHIFSCYFFKIAFIFIFTLFSSV